MVFQCIVGNLLGAELEYTIHLILTGDVSVCQAFMPRLRSRCRVTGFATGNFSPVDMKGLAADVESLLTVRTLPGFCDWTPIPCLLHLACFLLQSHFQGFSWAW